MRLFKNKSSGSHLIDVKIIRKGVGHRNYVYQVYSVFGIFVVCRKYMWHKRQVFSCRWWKGVSEKIIHPNNPVLMTLVKNDWMCLNTNEKFYVLPGVFNFFFSSESFLSLVLPGSLSPLSSIKSLHTLIILSILLNRGYRNTLRRVLSQKSSLLDWSNLIK